ncbi:uncharacterized protein LKV04_012727 [Tautogolabrus adspersus]
MSSGPLYDRAAYTSLKRQDTSLKRQDTSLKRPDTSLKRQDTSLKRQDTSLKRPDTSLKRQDTSLKRQDTSLKRQDTSLKRQDTSLKRQDTSLKRPDTSLKRQDTSLKSQDTSLKRPDTSLKRTDTSLKRQDTSLKRPDTSLKRTDTSLKRQDTSLKRPDTSLKRTDTSLNRQDTSLKRTDTSLKRQDTSLNRQDTSLKRTDTSLNRQDTSLKRPDTSLKRPDTRRVTKMDALLLLLFIVTASGPCAESSQVKRQFSIYYDHKTRDEALAFCRDKHTDLATITSVEDVDTLRGMVDLSRMWQIDYSNRAWIGLYDDVDSWSWSLSDPSFYEDGDAEFRQWSSGLPDNVASGEHCTTMSSDGLWNDFRCTDNLKSVCCDVTGPNVTFVLISTDMSWTEAQSYCREHHTDLASVRNMAENQEIKGLIPFLQAAWIGLSRETWKWLDGSNFSFRYWNQGFSEPNNLFSKEACVSADFGNFGKWEDWPCDYKRSYICYTAGITQQVIRVSVQKKKNPSVDLNHSAVMEHILQQLQQKLKDEGLHDNTRLSWRQQPDGNVFQREESETEEQPDC